MPKKPEHILVIRLSAMGDVAMSVPVLRALTEKYPDTRLTILTRGFFSPFFRDIPNLEVHNAEVSGKHKGIMGLYRLSKELRALKIDAVADLHNVLRSNILRVFLKGIRFVQINKGRAEKKKLVSGEAFKQLKTTHQRYADVFNKIGYSIDLANPKFPKKELLPAKAQSMLGKKTGHWIGIAPFAQYESKMYPLHLMQEVIKGLLLDSDSKILLFGGGNEEIAQLEQLQSTHERIFNMAGQFSLDEELDVISNLDIMLSMDSGNAHIAAMLGRKVVTVWGVTHPFAGFYPFNQDSNLAVTADRSRYPLIPTSVYGNNYPESHKKAIHDIDPDTILQRMESVLQKKTLLG